MSVETPEYAGMLRRMIRAYGRRVADADDVDLAEMMSVKRDLDATVRATVLAQHDAGRSWSSIGDALGISRQAAQQTYGRRGHGVP